MWRCCRGPVSQCLSSFLPYVHVTAKRLSSGRHRFLACASLALFSRSFSHSVSGQVHARARGVVSDRRRDGGLAEIRPPVQAGAFQARAGGTRPSPPPHTPRDASRAPPLTAQGASCAAIRAIVLRSWRSLQRSGLSAPRCALTMRVLALAQVRHGPKNGVMVNKTRVVSVDSRAKPGYACPGFAPGMQRRQRSERPACARGRLR